MISPIFRRLGALASLLAIFASLTGAAAETNDFARAKYNFNSDWRVKVADEAGAEAPAFADSNWKKVTLPYAWNEDAAFRVRIDDLPTGVAWYRKHFRLPDNAKGKKIFLEFEGIRFGGDFYLNGEFIGRSENGIMASGFDVSDKVKPSPEENVLAVRVDNAWNYKEHDTRSNYQWNDRNFYANYGGINKNVYLHITDPLHQTLPLYSNLGTTGVYIYGQDYDIPGRKAKVTAETQVKNERALSVEVEFQVSLFDREGKLLKSFNGGKTKFAPGETKDLRASSVVENLNFWSWGYGYLYDVITDLKVNGQIVDSVRTRTGFRKTEFKDGDLTLNDRALQLKGYAQRSTNEWPAVGNTVPPWMSDLTNSLMVESNGNLVRWMHVTPGKQDVESSDRVGLIQALPAGDSEKDSSGRKWEQRIELMRDAIIYNRNNPSVIFYEAGNKGISEEHMAEINAVRDKYDPHGGRASGSREMLGSHSAEWGGEMLYVNKSAGKPLWATEYSRDEGLRKYWDNWSPPFHKDGDGPMHKDKPAPGYNHNQDSHAVETVSRWYDYWRERPGTGNRVSGGGVNIVFSDSNTHARGESNYRTSGEVDAMRIPKDSFFAHQVMWDGWVDVENPRAHIVGHWNYEAGVKKPVYVISAADSVELFVNGKSLGKGEQKDRFLFTWNDVAFEPGTLKAVGYDAQGKAICEDVRKTAGAPVALQLTLKTRAGGLRADGADLALVQVEVVDAEGNRCPTALNLVKFELEGLAEWRGGIAQGPENYILAKELPVEGGINRVMLRSLPEAGKIQLRATADGLKSAEIELYSTPFTAKDGFSSQMPDEGATASLVRGPTPAGLGITPTRQPLKVMATLVGANPADADKTIDDNEETGWSNDNKRETGWIEYELEKSAPVSEVTMKLGKWRDKSYPIRILVDGKKAFEGETPRSLGYVTLAFPPVTGKKVRIELIGAAREEDAFGEIVEVTGKKLDDAKSKGGSGTLQVIETEIYGPAKK